MSNKTLGLPADLHAYVVATGVREPDLLRRLRVETSALPQSGMQIAPEQGAFLAMLVQLTGARRCIELGTFTGYSSTVVALALPDDGRLTCCDVSTEWTDVARRYWAEAGVEAKVDLRIGPALGTLDTLVAEGGVGTVDFAFVDAAKSEYRDYYERLLALLRPGGLMAFDNTLWHGAVIDASDTSADTEAIREFNSALWADDRVSLALLPIADGVTLARKL